MQKRKIILTPAQGKKTEAISATTDTDGLFCFQVQPGTYHIQVRGEDVRISKCMILKVNFS